MSDVTVVRQASWIVAWDETSHQHHYLKHGDVAFTGDKLIQVGGHFDGHADVELPGEHLMVMPGLVNIHSHPTSEPMRKGITDETLSPNFHHSSLYEFLTTFGNDAEGTGPCHRVAMAELLQSGCTTIVDYSKPFDGWLDSLAKSGIRACIAPMFLDAPWSTHDGHSLVYDWSDKTRGPKGLQKAQEWIEAAANHASNRLFGMASPSQIDTCSAELLQAAHAYAVEHDLAFQIHASQSIHEFIEITRRYGCTPIQWLDQIGVLSDRSIIGHSIFMDHHPWVHWTTRCDLDLLVESGATVAHCPTVFMRRGVTLRSFGRYLKAGVNLGIGTDTYPHNLLEEMRNAAMTARVSAGSVDDLTTTDVFNAATTGGASALRRSDIGRLEAGAKADLVLVDLQHAAMRPMREPIRSLIYVAAERAVKDVFVDGQQVVRDGRCLTIDLDAELAALEAAQQRCLERVPSLDHSGRTAQEMSPFVFQIEP
ncbi:MAG: amidohydrolase family protein [Burkholderiaceae bacterium]